MKETSPLLWGKAKNIMQLPLLPQASEDESELEAGIGPMCQAACAGLLPTSTQEPSTSTQEPSTPTQVWVGPVPVMNSQVSLVKRDSYSFWRCLISWVSKGNTKMRAFMSPRQVTIIKCSSREWSFQTHTTLQRIQHFCSPHFKEQETCLAVVTCPV